MSVAAVRASLNRLRALVENRVADRSRPILGQVRRDPAALMAAADMPPDPWQASTLRRCSERGRTLILASRQAGKSQLAAALALKVAFLQPGALVLLLSPTLRQSGELFRDKVLRLYGALGRPVPAVRETALELTLANSARIVSLPGVEANIRGYSGVSLLVVDEGARVPDALYRAVRPMLAVSGGGLLAISSAWAKQGWFFEAWHSPDPWARVKVTADQCPRISREFLAEERRTLGARYYAIEYGCEFGDLLAGVWDADVLRRAVVPGGEQPLF